MKRAVIIFLGVVGLAFFTVVAMQGSPSEYRVPISCTGYENSILIESKWRGKTERVVLGPDAIYIHGAVEPLPWRQVWVLRGFPVWPDPNSRDYYLEVHGGGPPFAVDRDCWKDIGKLVPEGVGIT